MIDCVVDRDLTTSKRKMETDVSSQRSVIEESNSRITMLENILAKEAVCCLLSLYVCDEKRLLFVTF